MDKQITDLIFSYVAYNVNFKSVNEENIDKVAGRISIGFCKAYSPRKNWDVSRKDIKAFMIDIFRRVMDGKLVFIFEDECDDNE